jgi:hypothetical protein
VIDDLLRELGERPWTVGYIAVVVTLEALLMLWLVLT